MASNTKTRKWLYGLGGATVVAAAFATMGFIQQDEPIAEATTQQTAIAYVGDLETTLSAKGNLVPATEATLSYGVSGQIADVLVAEGEAVVAGEQLVLLETAAMERQVNDATLNVALRKLEVDNLRSQELLDAEQRVIDAEMALDEAEASEDEAAINLAETELTAAQEALDTLLDSNRLGDNLIIAEAQLQQVENALESAENNLAAATLTAPFNGIISHIKVREGDYATGPILTMFDPDSLMVTLDVDEIDLRDLEKGTDATLAIDALPSLQLDGSVYAIAAAPNATNGSRVTYQVDVALDEMDDDLRYGMSAQVNLTTSERDDVLLVPNDAITADSDEGTFYVTLVEGDTKVRVEVTIGVRDSNFTEIKSGLSSGDEVVLRTNSIPVESVDEGGGPPRLGG